MSPGDRCDEVIRLIDEVLAEQAVAPAREQPARSDTEPRDGGIEELPGHWGVYYLRPSA